MKAGVKEEEKRGTREFDVGIEETTRGGKSRGNEK